MRIISKQLDIKLGPFTQEELDSVLKNRKATGLDKIPPEVWKTRQFDCNIIAEGFRFMPLGLVRLRTFRLSTWVS